METMKGNLQPQSAKASALIARRSGMIMATASRKPSAAVRMTYAVHAARFSSGAC
jgi:hypothetical protein